ncbi:hypothetical protein [Magnetospirillum aberrantis]|uniref:Uncharacterized protein n=1 Tax=Magnetospirillum aberrantis SpK TaxID=908842 RepID=A0A7C9QV16_9PROT|nr:hypothetical protein [Magnetospirillum aberrantis]NFV81077.1 hypothetical protein [Magnetospirillum aberrantis SpK]
MIAQPCCARQAAFVLWSSCQALSGIEIIVIPDGAIAGCLLQRNFAFIAKRRSEKEKYLSEMQGVEPEKDWRA